MVGTGRVAVAMSKGGDVGLARGVTVGSGVFVAVGIARAVCVYPAWIVPATRVKAAFISRFGAAASGEPQALRARIRMIPTRMNGECDFRIMFILLFF
jgi:hypothetical protein